MKNLLNEMTIILNSSHFLRDSLLRVFTYHPPPPQTTLKFYDSMNLVVYLIRNKGMKLFKATKFPRTLVKTFTSNLAEVEACDKLQNKLSRNINYASGSMKIWHEYLKAKKIVHHRPIKDTRRINILIRSSNITNFYSRKSFKSIICWLMNFTFFAHWWNAIYTVKL